MARATFKIDLTDSGQEINLELRTIKPTMDNVTTHGRDGKFLSVDYNTFTYNPDGTIEYK